MPSVAIASSRCMPIVGWPSTRSAGLINRMPPIAPPPASFGREATLQRMAFPVQRPRRLRRTPALRSLVRETDVRPSDLIAPLFVKEGLAERVAIASMPGQFQHTLESLRKEAHEIA